MRLILYNCLFLLIGLLALELTFGDWLKEASYGRLNLPRDVQRTFDVSHLYNNGGKPVTYTRDAHGLRGAYDDISQIDILTLGGSTTNELYVDDAAAWPAVLAQQSGLTVVNAGVDGQSTVGHIYNFEAWFPNVEGLEAKYVLAYIGINDMFLDGRTRFDFMQEKLSWKQPLRFIQNHSALYKLVRTVQGMIEAKSHNVVHGDEPAPTGPWQHYESEEAYNETLQQDLAAYQNRLIQLAERIESFGARPIFITQPAGTYRIIDGQLYGTEGNNVGPYFRLKAFNETLMQTCVEQGYTCFDLFNEVQFEDGDFYDPYHTTPSGSLKVGEYLAKKMQ